MTDLTIVAADVAPVRVIEQHTLPAAAAITVGAVVYIDSAGKFALADGSSAGPAAAYGIAMEKATEANEAITAVRKGIVDLGDALDALAFGASVYLSDTNTGILGDVAGTVSKVVGTVIPGWGATAADKLLRVDC
jgi:predicted RecA/RadA family phage recombinase